MRYTVDCAEGLFEEWEEVATSDDLSTCLIVGERMMKLGLLATIWEGDIKVWDNGDVVSHLDICPSCFEQEFEMMFGKTVPNVQTSVSPYHPDQTYIGLITEARL